MSHRIRCLPGEREFFAEPGESLLDAALRFGLEVSYNCNGGSCGSCKARLVAGPLGPGRPHDAHLTQAERAAGVLLMCASSAAGDLVLELPAAGLPPLQTIDARLERLSEPTAGHLVLLLRTPRSRTLRFRAGQRVRLAAGAAACELPVASCPCNGMSLEFHLGPEDGGAFAAAMRGSRLGAPVRIEGPFGELTLDESSRRPLLFIAEGTRFAVVKSLIEQAIALELPQPIALVQLCPGGRHYLDNYCRTLVDALDSFTWLPLDPAAHPPASLPARFPDVAGMDLHLATGAPLAEALAAAFAAAGTAPERIFRWP